MVLVFSSEKNFNFEGFAQIPSICEVSWTIYFMFPFCTSGQNQQVIPTLLTNSFQWSSSLLELFVLTGFFMENPTFAGTWPRSFSL